MKEYSKPVLEIVDFAAEAITDDNEQGTTGTSYDDGGL